MINPAGSTIVQEVLRELKLSNEEDQQINRQQANSFFDQKIAELNSQVDLLKEQANKVGSMGIFNFVVGMVTSLLSIAGGYLETVKTFAAQKAVEAISFVTATLQNLQGLLNSFAEKDKLQSDAKIKESQMLADTFEKFYTDYHAQEEEASKRASDVLQTMREVRRETTEAHSNMAKI